MILAVLWFVMRMSWHGAATIGAAITLAACSGGGGSRSAFDPKTGVSASPRLISYGERVPKGGGRFKIGSPYQVSGRWYVPRVQPDYDEVGVASWYGDDFHGRLTANGEIYDMDALSAAHPTLPLPSYAYVTNLRNGRTILLRVNDRGPYARDRIIDLSRKSARALGLERAGTGQVRVTYAGQAPLGGHDGRERDFLAEQRWHDGTDPARSSDQRADARHYADDGRRPVTHSAEPVGWTAHAYRRGVGMTGNVHPGPRSRW